MSCTRSGRDGAWSVADGAWGVADGAWGVPYKDKMDKIGIVMDHLHLNIETAKML